MLKAALSACVAFVPATPSQAAITPAIEGRASALMKQGNPRAAYALLRRNHDPAKARAQHWFILGIAAYRSGDLAAAERAFRQVLVREPQAPRAKLELARVLHKRGQLAESGRLFQEVRALNPPARVAANIDRFLAMMRDRNAKGHAYRVRATVGAGYDSNANQATDARMVTLFGLPFLLNRDARRRGSGFAFFKGEFDHIYRFDRHFAWATSVSFAAKKQFTASDYDAYTVMAATGPVLQPGNRTTIMLPFFVNVKRYENSALASSDRFYSNEFGIAPQLRHAVSRVLTANLSAVFSRRHYFQQSQQSANVARVAAGVDVKVNARNTLSGGLIYGRELARRSFYSNRSVGAQASWRIAFARNFVVILRGSLEKVRYDSRQPIYSAVRRDRRFVAGADAIYKLDKPGGEILLSYARTWNNSNLAIFDFDRDVLSMAYRKPF